MAAKIKKGDQVVVLAGKDKGKTGEVIRVMPAENRALVRGVNVARRHQQPDARASRAASSPRRCRSTCRTWRSPTTTASRRRVGFRFNKDGQKVRFAKRSGDVIDG